MKTELTKKDFYFNSHKINENGTFTVLSNSDTQHRFGGKLIKDNGKFQLRPQSCGNPCQLVRTVDSWIRAINWAYALEPQSYKESILEFDTIERANKFIDNLFKMVDKFSFKGHISSGVLGLQYYKYLPKGFIEIRIDKKFYHYIFDIDTLEFKKFDFEPIYNKYYNEYINLYDYNFKSKQIEPNRKNKSWV